MIWEASALRSTAIGIGFATKRLEAIEDKDPKLDYMITRTRMLQRHLAKIVDEMMEFAYLDGGKDAAKA